jgi:ABC-type Fe3+ transport system permease subunit
MTDPSRALSGLKASDRWWAAGGVAAVGLFVLGLVFADFVASPGFPAYDASLERINAFFNDNRAEAIGISVCHSLSAAALLVFVAYLVGGSAASARPRHGSPRWPLAEGSPPRSSCFCRHCSSGP